MSSTHLSLPLRLPDEERERYDRLATLTTQTANTLLEQYWTPDLLTGINDSSYQVWKYFDEQEAFEEFGRYLPSRYKRCLLQKVGETLRSHADKRDAFQTVKPLLPDHKIRRIHTRRIKELLWDSDEYLSSEGVIQFISCHELGSAWIFTLFVVCDGDDHSETQSKIRLYLRMDAASGAKRPEAAV